MADLLDRGAKFLHEQRHSHMTREIVYSRSATIAQLNATIGETLFEQGDESGIVHRIETRDFIVRASDLSAAGLWPPMPGDRIREAGDSTTYIYEVMDIAGEPSWKFSDRGRRAVRIHAKQVDTE